VPSSFTPDSLKIFYLIADPDKVCPPLLLHGDVAVSGRFSPIARVANVEGFILRPILTVLTAP
jgi:hypothetical protein